MEEISNEAGMRRVVASIVAATGDAADDDTLRTADLQMDTSWTPIRDADVRPSSTPTSQLGGSLSPLDWDQASVSSAGQRARGPVFWLAQVNRVAHLQQTQQPGHGTVSIAPSKAPPAIQRTVSIAPTQAPHVKRPPTSAPQRIVYATSVGASSVHPGGEISDFSDTRQMSRRLADNVAHGRESQPQQGLKGDVTRNAQRMVLAK